MQDISYIMFEVVRGYNNTHPLHPQCDEKEQPDAGIRMFLVCSAHQYIVHRKPSPGLSARRHMYNGVSSLLLYIKHSLLENILVGRNSGVKELFIFILDLILGRIDWSEEVVNVI